MKENKIEVHVSDDVLRILSFLFVIEDCNDVDLLQGDFLLLDDLVNTFKEKHVVLLIMIYLEVSKINKINENRAEIPFSYEVGTEPEESCELDD